MFLIMTNVISHLVDVARGKTTFFKRRSSAWKKFRDDFIRENPVCKVCGGSKNVIAHHIIPFHKDPALELEKSNLVTLCESGKGGLNCHLFCGHKGNYRDVNQNIKDDAVLIKQRFFNI